MCCASCTAAVGIWNSGVFPYLFNPDLSPFRPLLGFQCLICQALELRGPPQGIFMANYGAHSR